MSLLKGKRVLVTGACGTVGKELIRQLLSLVDAKRPAEVVGIDNHESNLFFIDQTYLKEPRATFFVVDVRDRHELSRRLEGVDVVFHTAAMKHVILSERSPSQAIQTNIEGVQNVIDAAMENNVEKVIFTSSDKAVNPTNVMGTSKLMGERLMTAANSNKLRKKTVFASTRFGNVLGSSGSVVPIFHRQIAEGGPVTLTDPEMSRFVMSIEDAVRLVLDSAELARGGEVFITKMPVLAIRDLAAVMIALLAKHYGHDPDAVEITTIGTKPGEKLYEELMSTEEMRRSIELTHYFAVLPAFRGIYHDIDYCYEEKVADSVQRAYVSSEEELMTHEQISALLMDNEILSMPVEAGTSRYWPGDKEEND